jgi:hypothetical protein
VTDEIERNVRAMLQQRAAEMPPQQMAAGLAGRVARRRTTKLALAGVGAVVVVALVAAGVAAATGSDNKHQRVITSVPTSVSPPTTTRATSTTTPRTTPAVTVAGVGCPTSSVTAPFDVPAPTVGTRQVAIADAAVANRVRSYVGPRAGFATDAHALEPDVVLGPAGWSCRVYRSNGGGAVMYVFPPSVQGSFGPGDSSWTTSEQYAGTEVRVETALLSHGPDISLACAAFAGDPLVDRWQLVSAPAVSSETCAAPAGRVLTRLGPGVIAFVDADGTRGVGVMRVRASTERLPDADYGIVTCKLTGADASLCDAIIADYTARYPGVEPDAPPIGIGGAVTTAGRVGTLQLAQSTEADVRATLGAPEKTARASFEAGALPAYDALGYECTSRSGPATIPLVVQPAVSGPYCDTVYFINTMTKTLAAFETTSSQYATARGTTVGMTPVEAAQREGKQIVVHGCAGTFIRLGSFYQDGAAFDGAALFIFVGPTANDRVGRLALESNVNPVGMLFC